MADRDAAERLKRALRIAMTEKGIDGWVELALACGVSPTTVENWIYARTVPQAKQLRRVGDFLRPFTSPSALETAYAGLPPEEPPIIEVLREIAPDLHELLVLMRAQYDQAERAAFRSALEERRRGRGGFLGAPPDTPSDESGDRG